MNRLRFFPLLVLSVSLLSDIAHSAQAVDQRLVPAVEQNNCVLVLNANSSIVMRVQALGDNAANPAFYSGIAAVEGLKVTAGATLLPSGLSSAILNDSRWLSDVRAELIESLPVNISFPRPCSDPAIGRYKAVLQADPQIQSVRERPPAPRVASEILPPKRPAPNDPLFKNQYSLDCSGQSITFGNDTFTCSPDSDTRFLVGPYPNGGYRVRVYGIDTGLDLTHSDVPLDKINPRFSINMFAKTDAEKTNFQDPLGHGTHVAGILGAVSNNGKFISGVAAVEYVVVRAFDKSGSSSDEVVTAAIYWVVNTMEISRREGDKILGLSNNSWTAFGDQPGIYKALSAHLNAGVPFVCAAGNAGQDNDPKRDNVRGGYDIVPARWAQFPEFFDKPLVVVGGSDFKNNLASFANYGPRSTHLVAPAVAIDSLVTEAGTPLGSIERHRALSGTSMATPQVAGAIAMLIKKEGESAVKNISLRALASSDKFPQFFGKIGGGRLNMYELWRPDNKPPPKIKDIVLSRPTFNSASFGFTAVQDFADDGLPRQMGAYLFRTSLAPITEDNFRYARPHLVFPPLEAGRPETVRLDGLKPDTIYYAAMLEVDKGGNSVFVNLPSFKTRSAQITWFESTGVFDKPSWQKENIGQLENLWHFDPKGNLVFRAANEADYDTGKDNGGLVWSRLQEVPDNARLVLGRSQNTGIEFFESATGRRYFEGDYLFVLARNESGQIEEIAKLPGNGGRFQISEFSLKKFEGKKIRVGFRFNGSYQYAKAKLGGAAIYSLEIYGTRRDLETLSLVSNGDFNQAVPSKTPGAPNWMWDPLNWQVNYICPGCLEYKIPEKWFVTQLTGPDAADTAVTLNAESYSLARDYNIAGPDFSLPPRTRQGKSASQSFGPAAMRIWNETKDSKATVAATSDTVFIRGGELYELDFSAKLSGNLVVILTGFNKDNKGGVLSAVTIKDSGASWKWTPYRVAFLAPAATANARIGFLVTGKSGSITAADIDDVRIDFLKKTFPETTETQNEAGN